MTPTSRPTRHRLGLYIPGNGHSGPWRSVHSILAGLDPAEFDVVLLSGLDRYAPCPWVAADPDPVWRVASEATRAGADLAAAPGWWRASVRRFRGLVPACGRLWLGFGRETARLAGWFRKHRIDLLHTHNAGCEEAAAAARVARISRVVGTFHVDPSSDLGRVRNDAAHRLLECLSNQSLDVGVGVSRATGDAWVRRTHIPASRAVTIYNGIDPEKFRRRQGRLDARRGLGIPDDAGPVIGGVGRLDPAKGFEALLRAAALLMPAHPRLLVVLAGDGPLRSKLEAAAADLGIAGRVRFAGYRTDVQPVYDALDVFALPSRCEALPYALLEAMSTGLPAVGAAVGGVPEVIVPGATGFLVRPGDPNGLATDPHELATSLHHLAADPDLCARFGTAGRDRVVSRFHERDMVRRTIELYRRTLAGARRSAGPVAGGAGRPRAAS